MVSYKTVDASPPFFKELIGIMMLSFRELVNYRQLIHRTKKCDTISLWIRTR